MILNLYRTDCVIVSPEAKNISKDIKGKIHGHRVYNYNLDFIEEIPFDEHTEDIVTNVLNELIGSSAFYALKTRLKETEDEDKSVICISFVSAKEKILERRYTVDINFLSETPNGDFKSDYRYNPDYSELDIVVVEQGK